METQAVRDRLEALEQERAEEIARANAALAAAQDRSYWLERWNLDLNAVMRKRGASELRAAVRALRAVYRLLYKGRMELPGALARARGIVEQERAGGRASASAGPAARAEGIAQALAAAGLRPRAGDTWLGIGSAAAETGGALAAAYPELARHAAEDAAGALQRVAELGAGVAPGSRLFLGADSAAEIGPHRLLERCTPDWRIALYRAGDPDLYVLERR